MMKFRYIPNMEKFAEALKSCHGKVLLHLPDNTTCDLKSDSAAFQMLKMLPSGYHDLRLSFSDPRDTSAFMQYMLLSAHGLSAYAQPLPGTC